MADRRQLALARVAHLHGEHGMACGKPPERPGPRRVAEEVRHDDDQAAPVGDALARPERVGQCGRRAVGAGLRAQRPQELHLARPAVARRQEPHALAGDREAEPVAAAAGEPADHERHALGHVGLGAIGRAELHRRRGVEHDPRFQLALGHVDAHVRLARARGRGRVEVADVVSVRVRPQLLELAAGARPGRGALAGHQPADAAREREVERVDERRRDRPGPQPPWSRRGAGAEKAMLITPPRRT